MAVMTDEIERLRDVWEAKRAAYDKLLVTYFGPGLRLNVEMPPTSVHALESAVRAALPRS